MDTNDICRLFDSVKVWKSGVQQAPHKSLLLLYAISRCARGLPRLIDFREFETDFLPLLEEFGPSRKSYHPEYPFWRLQNDHVDDARIWAVNAPPGLRIRRSNTDPLKSELRKFNVQAGFTEAVFARLQMDPKLRSRLARDLLARSFPETLHEDIASALGLDLSGLAVKKPRDPRFRDRVLTAYEYRCAVCSLSLSLGNKPVGLDAAHIQWHEAGGPSLVSNGIALCVLHHKFFDTGAFTLKDDWTLLLSERLWGHGFGELMEPYHGKLIHLPLSPNSRPAEQHLHWHQKMVFKGPSRYLA